MDIRGGRIRPRPHADGLTEGILERCRRIGRLPNIQFKGIAYAVPFFFSITVFSFRALLLKFGPKFRNFQMFSMDLECFVIFV